MKLSENVVWMLQVCVCVRACVGAVGAEAVKTVLMRTTAATTLPTLL